jgi:hypothetical protein
MKKTILSLILLTQSVFAGGLTDQAYQSKVDDLVNYLDKNEIKMEVPASVGDTWFSSITLYFSIKSEGQKLIGEIGTESEGVVTNHELDSDQLKEIVKKLNALNIKNVVNSQDVKQLHCSIVGQKGSAVKTYDCSVTVDLFSKQKR